jgi:hypothetical protein
MKELKDNFKKLQLFNLQENIEEYVKVTVTLLKANHKARN